MEYLVVSRARLVVERVVGDSLPVNTPDVLHYDITGHPDVYLIGKPFDIAGWRRQQHARGQLGS